MGGSALGNNALGNNALGNTACQREAPVCRCTCRWWGDHQWGSPVPGPGTPLRVRAEVPAMRCPTHLQDVTNVTQHGCMKSTLAGYDRFIITPTVRNGRGDEPWSTFLSRLGPGLVRVRGPFGDR